MQAEDLLCFESFLEPVHLHFRQLEEPQWHPQEQDYCFEQTRWYGYFWQFPHNVRLRGGNTVLLLIH